MKFRQLANEGGGDYLKLKDGESATGIPRGEIHSLKVKWENGKSVIIDEPNSSRHNRFKVNFLVVENGTIKAKIWEFGVMVYNNLAAIAEEMDISTTKIKVSRKGTGTDTEWHVIPLGPVDPKGLPAITAVALQILDKNPKQELPPIPWGGDDGFPEQDPGPEFNEDLPF